MSKNNSRKKLSEKGLLTPDNCVVALIDLQPQMIFGVGSADRQTIVNSNSILAKAAKTFDVPVVLSTVESKSFSGYIWPQLQAIFPQQVPSSARPELLGRRNFVKAIEGQRKQEISCLPAVDGNVRRLPTVQAIFDGYEVYVARTAAGTSARSPTRTP